MKGPPSPPPAPPEPPLPKGYIPFSRIETARIFNGLDLESRVETFRGLPASKERESDNAYRVSLSVRVNVPTPAGKLADLERLNPHLARLLPGLETLVAAGRVSDFYHGLYERKINLLGDQLGRLDQMVSRHNFYDCETILELEGKSSRRRALLVQGEMDVVADGSDGDRAPEAGGPTANFQPFTSYRWKKRSSTPNPFLSDRKRRLAAAEAEFAIKGLSIERNRQLRAAIEQLRREVIDLEKFSFLVADIDPFIVVPGFMQRYPEHPFAPKIGDLAVVIHGDRAFPALVGDVGPSYKAGEASLVIAKAVNPRSDAYRRPVSDLGVTYLVFPGTAFDPPGPPDLSRMRARCLELLGDVGGFGGTLHDWRPPPPQSTNVVATAMTAGDQTATNAVTTPAATNAPAAPQPPPKL